MRYGQSVYLQVAYRIGKASINWLGSVRALAIAGSVLCVSAHAEPFVGSFATHVVFHCLAQGSDPERVLGCPDTRWVELSEPPLFGAISLRANERAKVFDYPIGPIPASVDAIVVDKVAGDITPTFWYGYSSSPLEGACGMPTGGSVAMSVEVRVPPVNPPWDNDSTTAIYLIDFGPGYQGPSQSLWIGVQDAVGGDFDLVSLQVREPVTGCVADIDDGQGLGNRDGGVTIDDLLYFLWIFERGMPAADLDNGSGLGIIDCGVTIDDLLYYLFRFEQGC